MRAQVTRSSAARTAVTALVLALAFAWTVNTGAQATHTPANKVVAAGDTTEVVGPGEEVTLLTATLRTSKPTDLILHVAMECSIITDVQTGPSTVGGAMDSSMAEGRVRAWVEIDGEVVPINSMSEPPQNPPAPGNKTEDGVTFCSRVHQQDAEDAEDDGLDKYRTYLETKNANAFNWLRLNMGSGVHTIVVKADLEVDMVGHSAGAEALIGNRSLIATPEKLANDATI